MSEDDELKQRLADLEILSAHQEETIQQLSSAAAKQWDTIDELVAKVERLKQRLLALEDEVRSAAPNHAETPPPHY